ncbi:MAG: cell division protein FtsQ [Thermoleophilaceae bacterium]|jgi:cell division protein FtsQ|nr:cell division protein FtsQ [Thermoleophilaceae bacterium]MEA2407630.1 cell division protein FtsQ [Thermoleophilaceae bacterium]
MSTATLALRRIGRVRPLAALPPSLRRRVLITLAVSLVLAAGYQFWLRDSSLVAVEKVTVSGLTTKDADRVRAALTSAAHAMTTLHVRHDELEQAIVAYPVVRALEVRPDFPHGLQIHVVEHRPAAVVGGVPVAGDGTILRGLPVEGRLPTIPARGNLHGTRLKDPVALHAALVAGGAPAALRSRLERVEMRSQDGLVVTVRDGPELIFGDARRVHAKWIAAARVLADPDAAGATYIDVRLPGRPAAGGLPAETLSPVAPAGAAELAPPTTAAATDTTVDPATEPLAPAPTDTAQPAVPQSAPATPAPTDSTGAGGASPPPG